MYDLEAGLGGGGGATLQLYQPMHIMVFLSFFSPLVLAVTITSMSFVFQHAKGLVYLGFLIGACVLRNFVFMVAQLSPFQFDPPQCKGVQFSPFANASFSVFVFSFTLAYLAVPMWNSGLANVTVLISILVYGCIDLSIKMYKGCLQRTSEILANVLLGGMLASIVTFLMQSGGSGDYLFFNELSSTRQICYQPKEQTFKCSMYRDGELISSF